MNMLLRYAAKLDAWSTRLFNPLMNFYYRLKYRASRTSLERLATTLTTPEAVAAWVRANIEYRMDPVSGLLNNTQQPEITLARGAGDCDDFSYLCLHLLQRQGYQTWLLTLFANPIQNSHTICVFLENGTYNHISNWGLFRVAAPDMATLADSVMSTWVSGHIQTPDLQVIQTFTRETIMVAAARLPNET